MNGKVIRELGAKADPTRDSVTVDGRTTVPERLRYVAYHKPVGVVSSMSDPQGRPCIGDVTKRLKSHLFPVGRLDYDSSGLVLLTNDGEVAQRLSHPRFQVPKVYRVKVRGHMDEKALGRIRTGLRLADGLTAPARVMVEGKLENKMRLRVTIREGRQRQVRRMFEAVGHPVDKLSRASIGPVRLGALKIGSTRELTTREVLALRKVVQVEAGSEDSPAPDKETRPVKKKKGPAARGSASASSGTPRRPRR